MQVKPLRHRVSTVLCTRSAHQSRGVNMTDFDKDELPNAIATLFRLNNYSVRGPVLIHGAEIDLVATPIGGPFPTPIYIEATIEYVDNDKYGKDVTKLAMVGTM